MHNISLTTTLLISIALLMLEGQACAQGLAGNTKTPLVKSELTVELIKAMSDSDKKRIYIIQGEDYVVIKSQGGKDNIFDASIINDPKPKVGNLPTITPITTPHIPSNGGAGKLDSIMLLSKIVSIIDTCKAPKVFLHVDSYQCMSKEEVAKK